MSYIFTSESVSEGHPDKLCDRVSDTVLDLFLKYEPEARVACETLATVNRVVLAGEVRASETKLEQIMAEIEPAVRAAVKDIGYEQDAFHHAHFEFQNYLHEQSSDIAMGVDSGDNKDEGAGDQGLMFGYACDETDVLMPAAIHYSHQILKISQLSANKTQTQFLARIQKAKSASFMMIRGGQLVRIRLCCRPSIMKGQPRPTSLRW